MIRHLRYHEIDFGKYARCIQNSAQRKYCAEKTFLDTVAGQAWELLVLDDYQAVMPFFRTSKFFIKLVAMPKLCQQLGVFSEADDSGINGLFYNYLHRNFLVRHYAFNAKNCFGAELPRRVNYYIPPQNFAEAFAKFKPQRKKKIQKTRDLGIRLSIAKRPFESVLPFLNENFPADFKDAEKRAFMQILSNFYKAGQMEFPTLMIDNQTACVLGIYKDEFAAVLLITMNHPELMKLGGASYLICEAMRENIGTRIFDFEGSEIPPVREFFRGFRPEAEYFPVLQNSKKSLLLNLFKLRR